ncbi:50S ribosomal protein L19e [Candidatus Micrarchaeota archaeon]|nr:50S ribosomal protein L19e [Candidatus Micrarchaeota archaeon]
MSSTTVKRLAADILKIGVNKVRIKTEDEGKVMDALTRDDVRNLIKDGSVFGLERRGVSRIKEKSKKRRGRRKGKKYSRKGKKELWMEKVRAQRKHLRELLGEGKLDLASKRNLYLKIKGGMFKSKAALDRYLSDNKILKE